MIKRMRFMVVGWLCLLGAVSLQAQEAVKLGSGAKVQNTIIWGNEGTTQLSGGGTLNNNYIQGDKSDAPGFLAPERSDFRLKKGSPCIDAGLWDNIFNAASLDLWGNIRLSGSAIDIGAHEYRTYKIYFRMGDSSLLNTAAVTVNDDGIDGTDYDSARVEPGSDYRFELSMTGIVGLEDVTIDGRSDKLQAVDGIYTLSDINRDITIYIHTDPSLQVTWKSSLHGSLTITRVLAPGGTLPADGHVLAVDPDEYILLDTVADPGYYCANVWMRTSADGANDSTSLLSYAGTPPGYQVKKSLLCWAEFKPMSYPIRVEVNDRAQGTITATDNDSPVKNTSLAATGNTGSGTFVYAPDRSFTVSVTPATGYELQSLTVYDADGTSDPADIKVTRSTDKRVGGLVIKAVFQPLPYTVTWNCTDGKLAVAGDAATATGSKTVNYNTEITVVPEANTGYEYVAGSLTANGTPIGAAGKYTVKGNTTLAATFVKIRVPVTIEVVDEKGAPLAGNPFTTTSELGADNKVEYGSDLTVTPGSVTGYRCTEIWAGGIKQSGTASVTLNDIIAAVTVRIVFERLPYTITYSMVAPPAGATMTATHYPDQGGGAPVQFSSPGTVYYKDGVNVSVNSDSYHTIKVFTVNGVAQAGAVGQTTFNHNISSVEENYTVSVEFEPVIYNVTVTKSGEVGQATVQLKTGATVWGTVGLGENNKVIAIPYGTLVSVVVTPQPSYTYVDLEANSVDIKVSGEFTVNGISTVTTTIVAGIPEYHVSRSSVNGSIVVKNGGTEIAYFGEATPGTENTFQAGTNLTVEAVPVTGYLCTWIKANGGEVVSGTAATIVSNNYSMPAVHVLFTAEFVKACTVRITNPTNGVITVQDASGTNVPDGTVVPAGITLKASMTTNSGYYATGLAAEGNDLYTYAWTSTKTPVTTTGQQTYTIPVSHAGGDVTFTGTETRYYPVKFTMPANGTLAMAANTVALVAGTQYWYEENAQITVTASETTVGYELSPHLASNAAGVSADIPLTLQPGVPVNYGTGVAFSLTSGLDLSATFVRKKYTVTLNITLPAGKNLGDVQSAIGLTGGSTPNWSAASVQVQVEHGRTLTFTATPGSGFAARVEDFDNAETVARTTGNVTWTTPAVTEAESFRVEFIELYQVFYGADIQNVKLSDGTVVANGGYVYAGSVLTAYSASPVTGQECTLIEMKEHANLSNVLATSGPGTGIPDYDFTVPTPGMSVDIVATFAPKKYTIDWTLTEPTAGAAVIKAYAGPAGTVEVGKGGEITHGDLLKVTVTLARAAGGGAVDTWYEILQLAAEMNGATTPVTETVSGLTHTYTFTSTATGNVVLNAQVGRKKRNIVLGVTPSSTSLAIRLKIGAGAWQEYNSSYRPVEAPVGEEFQVQVTTGSNPPDGYELTSFPRSGLKETGILTGYVPIGKDTSLYAVFSLKKYPLTLEVFPAAAGVINAWDNLANYFFSGSGLVNSLEHGSSLSTIEVEVPPTEADYYVQDSIRGWSEGTDRLNGQSTPYHIDNIRDTVRLKAYFSRRYKALLRSPLANGTLTVYEQGTAIGVHGNMYAAGQQFDVAVAPDPDYVCSAAYVLLDGSRGTDIALTAHAGTYTIPAGATYKDVEFVAEFSKQENTVILKRDPADGGGAEVYVGEKGNGGTLLVSLPGADGSLTQISATATYGATLYLYAEPNNNFAVTRKFTGVNTTYSGPVTLTKDTSFTVTFKRLYRLQILDDSIRVYTSAGVKLPADTSLPEGTSLYFTARRYGKAYTEVTVKETGTGTVWDDWTVADADGVIEEDFQMPAYDAEVNGVSDWKQYTVEYTIDTDPSDATSDVLVKKFPGGATIADGGSVQHGDSLEIVLLPNPWYDIVSLTATMGGSPAGVKVGTDTLILAKALGDVVITAELQRRQKKLYLNMVEEALASGDTIRVTTEAGTTDHISALDSLLVDVGSEVTVQAIPGAICVVDSVKSDLGDRSVAAPFEITFDMPVNDPASVSAWFSLKRYEVTLERTPADGGSASLYIGERGAGGTLFLDLPLLAPQTEVRDSVKYGQVLYLYTNANTPDFELSGSYVGAMTPYSGPVTVTSDTVFSVRFGRLYKLHILDDSVRVYRVSDDSEVDSADLVSAGTQLYFTARQFGKVYTEVSVKERGIGTLWDDWTTADADGTIEGSFEMPGYEAEVGGVSDWKRYTVQYSVDTDPADLTSAISVKAFPGGAIVANGGSVQHGDSLVAVLTPHPWYEVVFLTATMGGNPAGTLVGSDTLHIAETTGGVVIEGELRRKQKRLYLNLAEETLASGNGIRVLVGEDGTNAVYSAKDSLWVSVGAGVQVIAEPEATCLATYMDSRLTGRDQVAPIGLNFTMPDDTLSVWAHFALKKYPVQWTVTGEGTLEVTPTFDGVPGALLSSGDSVKHYTRLDIVPVPDSRFRLKELTTQVGASVAADSSAVPSVTDAVQIEAVFERTYEVRVVAPDAKQGVLVVANSGATAVGKRFPAGTVLTVAVAPLVGYEVTGLYMNGVLQPVVPVGGSVFCTIPDNPAVDSVEFAVDLVVKEYNIKFWVSGNGSLLADGLAGGRATFPSGTSGTMRTTHHFDTLTFTSLPDSPAYRASRFVLTMADGSTVPVTAADTQIVVTGDMSVEVAFQKYYAVKYVQPDHGTLSVALQGGGAVAPGVSLPGPGRLEMDVAPDEGYELDYLSVNGAVQSSPFRFDFPREAAYDTIEIVAQLKVQTRTLEVIQPAYGEIVVERLNKDGVTWEILTVPASPATFTVNYWDQIRVSVQVDDPSQFRTDSLWMNKTEWTEGATWTVKENLLVQALIIPNTYTVYYDQPENGKLWVETVAGDTVQDGEEVYYLTELVVRVKLNDETGYELTELKVDSADVLPDAHFVVEADVYLSARIEIRTWEVSASIIGQGAIHVHNGAGDEIILPSDTVSHYEKLRLSAVPAAGWMLYSLEVYGAIMLSDSTFVVEGDVSIMADFRATEEYQFPAVFTPNGDGFNEVWEIKGLWQDPENTLEIYNRSQQRVYKVSPYLNEWNGTTDDGKILPAGNYVYKFTAGKRVFMGLVSIVRN